MQACGAWPRVQRHKNNAAIADGSTLSGRYANILCNCRHSFIGSQAIGMLIGVGHQPFALQLPLTPRNPGSMFGFSGPSAPRNSIAMTSARPAIPCTIAPWLTVRNGEQALRFYQDAFGARVVYRLEESAAGVVARLSVEGAEFWLSDGQLDGSRRESLGGGSVRMILTVADPDKVFAQALAAGASEVFPVGEEHGWRLGRLVDPFGLHWEIGHPLAA